MSDQREHAGGEQAVAAVHTGHPTALTYVRVAIILSTITGVEVAVFYLDWLGHGIIPVLVLLSGVKFALVIMFYMHLRYDARLFSGMFVTGLVLAIGIVLVLMALFKVFV